MGYTTKFEGRFNLDRPLYPTHAEYLKVFSHVRHMQRDVAKLAFPKPLSWRTDEPLSNQDVAAYQKESQAGEALRVAVGLPVGEYGRYYIGSRADFGQTRDTSILDYNKPPPGVPGLWCKWTPTEDRTGIEWNGAEKFYDYVEWLQFLIDNFLKPWGYKLTGEAVYQGEEEDDRGRIVVGEDQQVRRVVST